MLEAFRRDGGLIVDGMFNRATIDAMTAAADRRVEFPPGSATQGMGRRAAFVGANTVRFSSLPLLDDAYFDMLDNEIFAAIADAVLPPLRVVLGQHRADHVHRARRGGPSPAP